jgi:hypothetical protein
MAKKTRRARRPQPSPSTSPVPARATPEAARPVSGVSSTNGKKVDFAAEYYYVLHDLRTMGIIAAGMLVVLIALSFILH